MAIKMNLLPWREEQRQARKKSTTLALFLGAIVAAVISGLAYFYLTGVYDEYVSANQKVKNETGKLEKQLKEKKELLQFKEKLNNQINSVKVLQSQRSTTTKALEYLAKSIPDDLFLTKFTLKEKIISIEGVAENDSKVSELMSKLGSNELINTPQLTYINTNKELPEGVKEFKLTTSLNIGENDEEK